MVNGIIQYAGLYVYWKCSISRFLSFSLRSSLSFYPDCILLSFRDISDIRFNFAFSLRRKKFGKTSIESVMTHVYTIKRTPPKKCSISAEYMLHIQFKRKYSQPLPIKRYTCIASFLPLETILQFKRSAKDLISVGNLLSRSTIVKLNFLLSKIAKKNFVWN